MKYPALTVVLPVLRIDEGLGLTLASAKKIIDGHPDALKILISTPFSASKAAIDAIVDFYDLTCQSTVIYQSDSSIYDCWLKCIPFIYTDWITFVGCGDVLSLNFFQSFLSWISLNSTAGVGAFVGQPIFCFLDGKKQRKEYKPALGRIFCRMQFTHCGAIFSTSEYAQVATFTRLRYLSDLVQVYLLARRVPRIVDLGCTQIFFSYGIGLTTNPSNFLRIILDYFKACLFVLKLPDLPRAVSKIISAAKNTTYMHQ